MFRRERGDAERGFDGHLSGRPLSNLGLNGENIAANGSLQLRRRRQQRPVECWFDAPPQADKRTTGRAGKRNLQRVGANRPVGQGKTSSEAFSLANGQSPRDTVAALEDQISDWRVPRRVNDQPGYDARSSIFYAPANDEGLTIENVMDIHQAELRPRVGCNAYRRQTKRQAKDDEYSPRAHSLHGIVYKEPALRPLGVAS